MDADITPGSEMQHDEVRSGSASVWVVGHDGSENSRHAALWAAAHADGRTDELQVVTAWHIPADTYMPAPGAYLANLPDDLEASATKNAEELATALRSLTDVTVTATAAFGGAARSLIGSAPPRGLIVIGSRGRGGFARLLLGSTSTQVATHSSAPTVVVPIDASVEPAGRIVVAVDGSPNSLAAFDWAVRFAGPAVEVRTVHVHGKSRRHDDALDDDDPVADLATTLDDRAAALGHPGGVDHQVVEGSVRQELRRYAQDAGLFVMGARGHGAIGSALLGSVSTWLLHHLKVPMVVVPTEHDTGHDTEHDTDTNDAGEEDDAG